MGYLTAAKLFFSSPLGKIVLWVAAAALVVATFMWWLHGVEKTAHDAGYKEAQVAAQVEKDKYFTQLQTAITAFAANSKLGADNADIVAKHTADVIQTSVAAAIIDLAKNPILVVDPKTQKCKFNENTLGLQWAAINKASNQRAIKAPTQKGVK